MIRQKLCALTLAAMGLCLCACAGSRLAPAEEAMVVAEAVPVATPAPAATPGVRPMPRPTLSAAPSRAEPRDELGEMISGMTPGELIGQMVMIGFAGTADVSAEAKALMREYTIGNIIFFGQNVTRFAQAKALIEQVKTCNANPRVPLNICIDIEGGNVTRFRGQWKPFIKGAAALGKLGDPDRVFNQYTQIGETLRDIGFTLDLAPVADIAPRPSGTFLGARMFGGDEETVSPLIAQAVKGLHNGGVASMLKHFPGHGETATDSHSRLPVLNVTRAYIDGYSLKPFAAGIEAGADAILVAHLLLPQIDGDITSVSHVFITDILRGDMGFDGVVMSDDMRMAGIAHTYSAGEAAVRFIEAGGDIVLIGKQVPKQRDVLESLNAAYRTGRLKRARLEESVRRVMRFKQRWCGLAL